MKKVKNLPVGSKRAIIAGIDLFYPNKTERAKRRKVKKALQRIRTDSPEKVSAIMRQEGCKAGVPRGIISQRKFILATEKALRSKKAILHELAHFFKFGKFDYITANAIFGYLGFSSSQIYGHYARLAKAPDGIINQKTIKDTEWAIKHKRQLKAKYPEHDKKANIGGSDRSVSNVGLELGWFAAGMERKWKKPASGLFLIREICNGVPAEVAVKRIESGALDTEIEAFAKRHLANLLQDMV